MSKFSFNINDRGTPIEMKFIYILILTILIGSHLSYGMVDRNLNPNKKILAFYSDVAGITSNKESHIESNEEKPSCREKKMSDIRCEMPNLKKKCDGFLSCKNAMKQGTCLAINAAENAQQASEIIPVAARMASDKVKKHFAELATQAVAATEVALAAKKHYLRFLESELALAVEAAEKESTSYIKTQLSYKFAKQSTRQALQQLDLLTKALKDAEKNLCNSKRLKELAVKSSCVHLDNRISEVHATLKLAMADFEKTKKATYDAICAAATAQQRAQQSKNNC